MIILRQREFGKKAKEEESEDTKYSNKLSRIGKKVATAGGIGAGVGAGLLAIGGRRGAKAIQDIDNLNSDIRGYNFHMKDHFGHKDDPGFFGQTYRADHQKYSKMKSEAEDKIKNILKKDGKHITASRLGKRAVALGTGAAIAGGLAYGIGKAREGAKRYRLDIYKKDREAIRQELEEEQKKNKKSKK